MTPPSPSFFSYLPLPSTYVSSPSCILSPFYFHPTSPPEGSWGAFTYFRHRHLPSSYFPLTFFPFLSFFHHFTFLLSYSPISFSLSTTILHPLVLSSHLRLLFIYLHYLLFYFPLASIPCLSTSIYISLSTSLQTSSLLVSASSLPYIYFPLASIPCLSTFTYIPFSTSVPTSSLLFSTSSLPYIYFPSTSISSVPNSILPFTSLSYRLPFTFLLHVTSTPPPSRLHHTFIPPSSPSASPPSHISIISIKPPFQLHLVGPFFMAHLTHGFKFHSHFLSPLT